MAGTKWTDSGAETIMIGLVVLLLIAGFVIAPYLEQRERRAADAAYNACIQSAPADARALCRGGDPPSGSRKK
jgi:hypothetical protein